MIALHPQDWARVVGDDLVDYVRHGGALVRFLVGETSHDFLLAQEVLRERAAEDNLAFFEVNGGRARLHWANDLLQAVASQLDWRKIMTSFLFDALAHNDYEVPADRSRFALHEVAKLNGVASAELVPILNGHIRTRIKEDKRLTRDVRFALWAMATETMTGTQDGRAIDVTHRWLTSAQLRIKELRDFGIVQKIGRHNARSVLRSVLAWLPASGARASIVYVDARNLAQVRRSYDGGIAYTRPALTEAYEVMREFIDDTDDLHNALIVFAMHEEFPSVDPKGRGMGAYQALQFRVSHFAEANLPNPLANLVFLSTDAERRTFLR